MSIFFCSDIRDFGRTSGRKNSPGACSPVLMRIPILLCTALLTVLLLLTGHSAVFAAIVDEPMTGATAPGWILGGTPTAAILTGDGSIDPAGDGWLRLTDTGTNQAGYAYLNTPFSITSGVVIQYDYTTWGGDGADGYSIFLFDAATTPFQIGASGGSLGYAQKTVAPVSPGLSGGYVGIGIDEWGNFSSPTEGRVGGPGQRPNSVAVRGTASTSWAYLGGSPANVGQLWFNQGTRPLQLGTQYRKVVIYLTPVPAPNYLRVDVYLQFGYNQPLTPAAIGIYTGQPIPANVKIGYAASTGGSTNNHEIRNLLINPLQTDINLAIYKTTPATVVNAGDTVTYTVTARNYGPNPTITATDAPIIDIIPAELTGVTWTCAGSGGATCGAAAGSGNNISTVATLPFNSAAVYTVTGTASGAPTDNPFTNTAAIAPPAGVVDYHLPDNSASATVRIRSDLSASTKTVVDLNGGDVEFGDELRYILTLRETAGATAASVSVSDDIPANVTGFTVDAPLPSGASDFSTPDGTGVNGSGTLDIRNLTVPGDGSISISFKVTVSGADGSTIANSAVVTNPGGPGANPSAPTLTIAGGSLPGTGNKPLYLHDDTSTPAYKLSRTPMAVNPGNYVIIYRGNTTRTWALSPVLQAPVTISSGTVPVQLWLSSNANRNFTVPVTLRCGTTTVAELLTGQAYLTNGALAAPFTFDLAWQAGGDYTCPAGSTWELDVTNTQGGTGTGRQLRVFPAPTATGTSNVTLPSQNVINIDNSDIAFHTAAYPGGSSVATVNPGDVVYLRATVSDPFGSYDISGATLTLTDALGAVQVGAPPVAMTEVFDSNAATKIYEYGPYTVPAGGPAGYWGARVDADEGTEGTVSDYGIGTLEVAALLPNLTVVKSADRARVNSGDVITYTIVSNNSGPGVATAVRVIDNLSPFVSLILDYDGVTPPYQPFEFTPATSGLTLGTPLYYNSGGAFTPDFAAGEDGSIVRWEIPMTGSFSAAGSFTVRFKVRVK